MKIISRSTAVLVGLSALTLNACGGDTAASGTGLTGEVQIDGSSTVYPISEAVAEEFMKIESGVSVTVGYSGTGGGFKKFARGEIAINDASRPIKDNEIEACAAAGIHSIELPVAYDGVAVVVNQGNDFLTEITTEQLQKIWQPDSTVKLWSDVDSRWPAEKIVLFAPGADSGTFDYFTEAINGKSQRCRSDFEASEDDHVLVSGVAGEKYSLGFFGFAYYGSNKDKLKLLKVKTERGSVAPSTKTIEDGSYWPLSRPLFVYIRESALTNPEVVKFVDFYLENAATLANEVGYVGLPANIQSLVRARFAARTPGSIYAGGTKGSLLDMLQSK